jgi:hypothetical protein
MSSSGQKVSSTEFPLSHLSDRKRKLAAVVRAYVGRRQQGSRFAALAADECEPMITRTDAAVTGRASWIPPQAAS